LCSAQCAWLPCAKTALFQANDSNAVGTFLTRLWLSGHEAVHRAGAGVSSSGKGDFAAMLDELIRSAHERDAEEPAVAPSLHLDMMAQIDRLQGEAGIGDVFEAYGEQREIEAEVPPPVRDDAHPSLEPALEDLFYLDPASIARELGIARGNSPAELDRARRNFAMRYHPDRVPEPMRERAKMRMQIANMLIDQAKKGQL
jgi:hypothetical protein